MDKRARELSNQAGELRADNRLVEAGEQFTLAAYEYAGDHALEPPSQHAIAILNTIIPAALCYRMAGYDERGVNRCEMGELIIEDVFDRYDKTGYDPEYNYDRARKGVFYELLGHLRIVAGRDDADEAFDQALDVYEATGCLEFIAWKGEQHSSLRPLLQSYKRGLGLEVDQYGPESIGPDVTLEELVAYEREHVPQFVSGLIERGEWASDNEE
jgi:hypothetical protein